MHMQAQLPHLAAMLDIALQPAAEKRFSEKKAGYYLVLYLVLILEHTCIQSLVYKHTLPHMQCKTWRQQV